MNNVTPITTRAKNTIRLYKVYYQIVDNPSTPNTVYIQVYICHEYISRAACKQTHWNPAALMLEPITLDDIEESVERETRKPIKKFAGVIPRRLWAVDSWRQKNNRITTIIDDDRRWWPRRHHKQRSRPRPEFWAPTASTAWRFSFPSSKLARHH